MPTPAVAWCPGGLASAKAAPPLDADSAASIHADDATTQTWSRHPAGIVAPRRQRAMGKAMGGAGGGRGDMTLVGIRGSRFGAAPVRPQEVGEKGTAGINIVCQTHRK